MEKAGSLTLFFGPVRAPGRVNAFLSAMTADTIQKDGQVEGLVEVLGDFHFPGFDLSGFIGVTCDEDLGPWFQAMRFKVEPDRFQGFDPIESRHPDIADDQIDRYRLRADPGKSGFPVLASDNLKPLLYEQIPERLPNQLLIIDQQDLFTHNRFLCVKRLKP